MGHRRRLHDLMRCEKCQRMFDVSQGDDTGANEVEFCPFCGTPEPTYVELDIEGTG